MKISAAIQELDFCSGHFSELVKLTLLCHCGLRFHSGKNRQVNTQTLAQLPLT